MSESLNKVLQAVEPDGDEGWIEYALRNYHSVADEFYYLSTITLAAKELDKLRARIAYLEGNAFIDGNVLIQSMVLLGLDVSGCGVEEILGSIKRLKEKNARLEKKLADVKSMQEEEREWQL